MISFSTPEEKHVAERWQLAGQGHVFRFWDRLDLDQRTALLEQLRRTPTSLVEELAGLVVEPTPTARPADWSPPSIVPPPRTHEEKETAALRTALGETALRAGRCAALLVAGGQGTRLGFSGPKGLFPIGPISGKSLYQLHAERIRALGRRYGQPMPLLIMTRPANHDDTTRFFEEHDRFGLAAEEVHFFTQGTYPTFSEEGKVQLAAIDRLSESPDGHGGVVEALRISGLLRHLRDREIEHVFYFQVDNPLVRIADPLFLGHHIHENADVSAKVVAKIDPLEKVGVLANADGRLHVVEYSDLPRDLAMARETDGRLLFRAGNTAIHLFRVDFLERVSQEGVQIPYHLARKKIPVIDEEGEAIEPTEPNGVKIERFVFDFFEHARNTLVLEIRREEEFSPVKNASGADSAFTAQRDLCDLHGGWCERAGLVVARDEEGHVEGLLEVSPLYALDEQEFRSKVDPQLCLDGRLLLEGK